MVAVFGLGLSWRKAFWVHRLRRAPYSYVAYFAVVQASPDRKRSTIDSPYLLSDRWSFFSLLGLVFLCWRKLSKQHRGWRERGDGRGVEGAWGLFILYSLLYSCTAPATRCSTVPPLTPNKRQSLRTRRYLLSGF